MGEGHFRPRARQRQGHMGLVPLGNSEYREDGVRGGLEGPSGQGSHPVCPLEPTISTKPALK